MKLKTTFHLSFFLSLILCISATAQNYSDSADIAFKKHDYRKSVKFSSQFIKQHPQDTIGYSFRSRALSEIHQYEKAVNDREKIIAVQPCAVSFKLCGDAYSKWHRYKTAIEKYNKAIELNHDYPEAYLARAQACEETKEFPKGLSDLYYLKQLKYNPEKVFLELGNMYDDMDKSDSALFYYSKALELDPSDASVYNGFGILYTDIKEPDKAIENLDKAIELDPNSDVGYYNRALTFLDMKKFDRCIDDCNKSIMLDSCDDENWFNRAYCLEKMDRYEEALPDINRAIKLNPGKDYYCERGIIYDDMGRYVKAIKDYDRSLAIGPSVEAWYDEGLAWHDRIFFEKKALQCFFNVLKIDSAYTGAYDRIGDVYADMFNKDSLAILYYNKALKIEPSDTDAYVGLGEVYYQDGKYLQAIINMNIGIQLDPTDAVAFYDRAKIYYDMGINDSTKYQLALQDMNKAIELDPSSSDAHTYYSFRHLIWEELGNKENAEADLNMSRQLRSGKKTENK